MCTAIHLKFYAGRNLDIDQAYGGEVIITPKFCPLHFKTSPSICDHPAIIGIGIEKEGYPLYFDAVNEHGLYIAALNYTGNAHYHGPKNGMINLAPYEIIPYILATCRSIKEAKTTLESTNVTSIAFCESLPLAELHFFIADEHGALVAEPDLFGLNIHDNPIGVLTNNPPFPIQLFNLQKYAGLSNLPIENRLSHSIPFKEYSNGMSAIGLPGDLSSESRFVRAAFHTLMSQSYYTLPQIMHLLASVEMPQGSVKTHHGYERTEYTSAVDLSTMTYYYKAYDSLGTCSVLLSNDISNQSKIIKYPIKKVGPI